jgi:hypothetical protein
MRPPNVPSGTGAKDSTDMGTPTERVMSDE